MMKRPPWFLRILLLSFMLSMAVQTQAQLITNSGQEFWFAFPETYDKGAAVYWVNITGNRNTTGTVSVPGQAWSQNFTLTAGQVVRVNIPSVHASNIGSDMLFNKAIRVTSNDDIVVFAVTYHQFRHEAALVLPNVAIGRKYRAMTYSSEIKNGLQESEFCVISTGDTALVRITPSANVAGGKNANVPYIVTIPPNHLYQAQALASTDDLTGSLVESINGENISMYAGNVWSTIVCSPNSDPILEAMFPTNTWGRDYFLLPTPSVGKDYIRILADVDSTVISRDGVQVAVINAGQFFDDTISTIHRYTSNRPVAAAHFLVTGQGGCTNYTNTDPSMILLNPTEQMFLDSISFFAVDTNAIDSHFVHVLTHTSDTGLMFMDGALMTKWTTFVQDANFSYKTLRVQPGSHRLETSTGCGFIAYSMGIGNAVSYGYATGASLQDLDKGITYTNFGSSDTISKNDSILFSTYMREPPVSITWYFGDGDTSTAVTPTHVYTTSGTFYVEAHVLYRCIPYDTIRDTLYIPEFSSIYSVSTEDVNCNGGNDGELRVLGSYIGRVQLTGAITGDFRDTISNLIQGNYLATVIDSTGCANDTSITIQEPPSMIIDSIVSDSVGCFEDSTGKARVYLSGGSGLYTYLWDSAAANQTNFQANSLYAGSYRVTITDSLLCTIDSQVTVFEPPSLIQSGSQSNVLCNGDSTGKAGVVAFGGVPPYTYRWTIHGVTVNSDSATNLNADTFRIYVNDIVGCSVDSLFTITEPPALNVNSIVVENVKCFGDSAGSALVNMSGGTAPLSFAWSSSITSSIGDSAFNIPAGTHAVMVTDSNLCLVSDSFSIQQPPLELTVTIDATNVFCHSDSTGKAWAIASGGVGAYSFQWSANTGTQLTDTAFNLPAGSYQVQVTDTNSCLTDTSITITEPTELVVDSILSDSVLCYGDSTGSSSVVVSGGLLPYSYSWSANAGSQSTSQASNLPIGSYQVSITDSNNCSVDTSSIVEEPDSISLSGSHTDVLCFGDTTGRAWVSPSGGIGPYQFAWNGSASGQTGDTAILLNADTFRVFVTDRNSCVTDTLYTIQEPPQLNIDSILLTHVLCFGNSTGEADVQSSGGVQPYSYTWSANVTSSAGDSAYSLPADTFIVFLLDTNGCADTNSFIITEPPILTIGAAVRDLFCYEDTSGKAWTWVSGGKAPYSYQWAANAGSQTSDTAFGLALGNYQVVVTDSNACTIDTTVFVDQPDSLSSTYTYVNVSCFGFSDASIKLSVFGGRGPYSYSWSPGVGQTGDSLIGISSGQYSVLIRDNSGCERSDSINITQPGLIQLVLSNSLGDTICLGDQITLSTTVTGGTTPYQYIWNDGSSNASLNDGPLADSTYWVRVTDSRNCPGDTADLNISVIDVNAESVQVINNGPICWGDSTEVLGIHVGKHPPYTYAWNYPLDSTLGPHTVKPLVTSTYILQTIDQCGKRRFDSTSLTVNPLPVIGFDTTEFEACVPFELQFETNVNHPAGTSFEWNFGNGDVRFDERPTKTYDLAGKFDVVLKLISPFGCEIEDDTSMLVTARPLPIASFEVDREIRELPDGEFNVRNTSSGAIFHKWYLLDTLFSTVKNPEVIFQDTGHFVIQLIVENSYGCIDSTTKLLIVQPDHRIRTPNAFIPSKYGGNGGEYDPDNPRDEVFFPYVEYVDELHLMIFNRWGEKVFESFDLNKGWDGYYKGELSQQDVYVWRLQVKFVDGFEETLEGEVTLLH